MVAGGETVHVLPESDERAAHNYLAPTGFGLGLVSPRELAWGFDHQRLHRSGGPTGVSSKARKAIDSRWPLVAERAMASQISVTR